MRPYRRKEAFRYRFKTPIIAQFTLVKIADKEVTSSAGEINILDISPGGLRGQSTLELPDPKKTKITLEINFSLRSQKLIVRGEVVWKKELAQRYEYGIDFTITEKACQQLIAELKEYVKEKKHSD
ncbi:PilZ domain-containing protein [Halalkalibacter kiskunsagensis]|uniref:PilZ domain-containing protein n=1 Tax=Halalkalibacter kiskunsagensis TaxID=1548599 RepID=A0ABV6KJQ8_9BACI